MRFHPLSCHLNLSVVYIFHLLLSVPVSGNDSRRYGIVISFAMLVICTTLSPYSRKADQVHFELALPCRNTDARVPPVIADSSHHLLSTASGDVTAGVGD